MKIDDRLEKLKQFDTPSITNVVATYPDKEYCLSSMARTMVYG